MAHEFWPEKLNLWDALTSNEVKARGPLTKVMGLLPMLKFVFKKYRANC